VRQSEVFSKRGTAVLEAPEQEYAPEFAVPRRTSASPNRKLRRDFSDEFADDFLEEDDAPVGRRRRAGVRLKFRGGLPRTKWGRIAAGFVVVMLLGLCVAALLVARSMLLHDERFVIQESSAIEFEGNAHVTRAQLLSVFGEDVERNIFYVPLAQRRVELERLPWVAHATVMRLLPNRMRVLIVERTPVAFVREGNHIGLVDANGVLLDMPAGNKSDAHYSFPVVTGISASDPLSTRAARMKIFERFTGELDGAGDKISQGLSEVDLSNPEDVKALIPSDSTDVLVHFGEDNFLDRYRKFEDHLPEWKTQYPKLSSVDMRYERQVVLEMQPGAGVSAGAQAGGAAAPVADDLGGSAAPASAAPLAAVAPAVGAVGVHAVKKAVAHAPSTVAKGKWKVRTGAKHAGAAKWKPAAKAPAHAAKHAWGKTPAHAAKASPHVVRPVGSASHYNSSQVGQP
jgi:cell division protein FtsQ